MCSSGPYRDFKAEMQIQLNHHRHHPLPYPAAHMTDSKVLTNQLVSGNAISLLLYTHAHHGLTLEWPNAKPVAIVSRSGSEFERDRSIEDEDAILKPSKQSEQQPKYTALTFLIHKDQFLAMYKHQQQLLYTLSKQELWYANENANKIAFKTDLIATLYVRHLSQCQSSIKQMVRVHEATTKKTQVSL